MRNTPGTRWSGPRAVAAQVCTSGTAAGEYQGSGPGDGAGFSQFRNQALRRQTGVLWDAFRSRVTCCDRPEADDHWPAGRGDFHGSRGEDDAVKLGFLRGGGLTAKPGGSQLEAYGARGPPRVYIPPEAAGRQQTQWQPMVAIMTL